MVANYHKDSMEREKKAAREEQQKLRRIASNIARQIRVFWTDIRKVGRLLKGLLCKKKYWCIYCYAKEIYTYICACLFIYLYTLQKKTLKPQHSVLPRGSFGSTPLL